MDFVVTSEQILDFLKWVAAIGAAAAVFYKVIKPFLDTKAAAVNNTAAIEKVKELHTGDMEKIGKEIGEQKKVSQLQCKCLLALVGHELSGNDIQKLKNAKDELEEYLVEK